MQDALREAAAIGDPLTRTPRLNRLLGLQATAGDLAGARRTAESIPDLHQRAIRLVEVAKMDHGAGSRTSLAAARRAAELDDDQLDPASNLLRRVGELAKIAGALATHAGEAAAARETFAVARRLADTLEDPAHRQEAFHDLAYAQVEAADWAGAIASAAGMAPGNTQVDVLTQSRDFAGARRAAAAVTDAEERSNNLWSVARALVEAGDLGQSLETALEIPVAKTRASAVAAVAAAHAEAGGIERARTVFARALRMILDVSDPAIRTDELANLASVQTGVGDLPSARVTILAAAPGVERCRVLEAVLEKLLGAPVGEVEE